MELREFRDTPIGIVCLQNCPRDPGQLRPRHFSAKRCRTLFHGHFRSFIPGNLDNVGDRVLQNNWSRPPKFLSIL